MLSFFEETAPTAGKLIASDSRHPAEGSRVSRLGLKAFLNNGLIFPAVFSSDLYYRMSINPGSCRVKSQLESVFNGEG